MPTEFAVFPLQGALLLPAGKLPLNIFEPRYLRMIDDAMGLGRVIGMIQPDASRAQGPTGPALYKVGCLGRITSFSETEDGRYLVTLSGLSRFGVLVELEQQRGYRRVRADVGRFAGDVGGEAGGDTSGADELEGAGVGPKRVALLAALRAYFATQGFDANWDAIEEMPDATLVTTLAMVCPFEPPEKQALLEAPSPAERAATLLALLQMGAHAQEPGPSGRLAT